MVIITLLSERVAKQGTEFIHRGPMPECKDCKLKVACLGLEEGRKYRVTNIRSKKHQCKLTGEMAIIVEVEEIPIKIAVEKSQAIEGAIISSTERECRYLSCPHYQICFPVGVKPNMKHQILKIGKELNCSEKYTIVRVLVGPPKTGEAATS